MDSVPEKALLLVLLQDAILLIITLGALWGGVFVLRRLGRSASFSLAALGISKPISGTLNGVSLGAIVGIGALLMSVPVNALSQYALENLGYPAGPSVQRSLLQGLQAWISGNPLVAIPAAVLVVVVIGPVVEEVVFRGAIFNGLYHLGGFIAERAGASTKRGGAADLASFMGAALSSSILFALLHLEPALLPALLILALALCTLMRNTGSLLPSIVAHAVFNSFAVLLIILSAFGVIPSPL